jgi:molecular chaperone HtpG
MSSCEDLLPLHLRFMKGVVDSSDLSLNVSREMLQKDRQIATIRKAVTGRIYKMLSELLADDRSTYDTFWKNFGATVKEGIVRDAGQKDKILPLCLFTSTHSESLTTLDEYIERMQDGQADIYYIFGASKQSIASSPHLEKLKEKGYEVLLLSDPVDEFIVPQLDKYEERSFVSITDAELDLDTEVEKAEKEEAIKQAKEKLAPVLDSIRVQLQDDVKEVRISKRLKDSPVCLVEDGQVPSAQLEQLYRQMGQELPKVKRILEVNPDHPIFERMLSLDTDTQKNWADILYGQALLSEGSALPDPAAFSKQLANLMVHAG